MPRSWSTPHGHLHRFLETPRAPLLYALTLLSAAAALGSSRHLRSPPARLAVPAVVFLAAAAAASITGLYPHGSVVRFTALANWIAVAALIIAVVDRRRQAAALLAAALVAAAAAAASALAGGVEMVARLGSSSLAEVRLAMAYVNANGAGLFAATCLVICWGLLPLWTRTWQRLFLAATAALLAVCLILSYSKAAAAGHAAGLLLLAWVWRSAGRSAGPPPERAGGEVGWTPAQRRAVIVLAAAISAVALGSSLLQRSQSPSIRVRQVLWKQALHTAAARPLLGIGPGEAFPPADYDRLSGDELLTVRRFVSRTHTHNLPLEIAAATGIVGLGAFLWLVFAAGRQLLRPHPEHDGQEHEVEDDGSPGRRHLVLALSAGLIAWCTGHLGVMVLSYQSLVGGWFWILAGLAIAVASRPARARRCSTAPHVFASMLLLGVTLLVVARPMLADRLDRDGTTAFRDGRQEAGRRALRWASRLSPLDAELRERRGTLETDPARAGRHWREASARRPTHAPYRDRLGWLAWHEGDPDGARRSFQNAVRLDPKGVVGGPYQAHLAYQRLSRGHRREAVALLREAITLGTGFVAPPDWVVAPDGSDFVLAPAYHPDAASPDQRFLVHHHLGIRSPTSGPRPWPVHPVTLREVVLPAFDDDQVVASTGPYGAGLLGQVLEKYLEHDLAERAAEVLEVIERRFPTQGAFLDEARADLLSAQGSPSEASRQLVMALGKRHGGHGAAIRARVASRLAKAGDLRGAADRYLELLNGSAISTLTAPVWLDAARILERAGAAGEAARAAERAAFTSRTAAAYLAARLRILQLRLAEGRPRIVLAEARHALTVAEAGLQEDARRRRFLADLATVVAPACLELVNRSGQTPSFPCRPKRRSEAIEEMFFGELRRQLEALGNLGALLPPAGV